MSENCPEKNLEEFRYDAKLFKQAYRASLRAKESEEEDKRKKRMRFYLISLCLALIIFFVLFISNSSLFQKKNYLKMNSTEVSFSYPEDNVEPSDISKQEFDSEFVDSKQQKGVKVL